MTVLMIDSTCMVLFLGVTRLHLPPSSSCYVVVCVCAVAIDNIVIIALGTFVVVGVEMCICVCGVRHQISSFYDEYRLYITSSVYFDDMGCVEYSIKNKMNCYAKQGKARKYVSCS